VIDMQQDEDGVFRPTGPDTPLPYGLPQDPQEPYVAIVAPNIDKISSAAFTPHTLAGRRTRRGLVAVAASVAGGLVVIGLVVAAQSLMALLGAD